MISAVPQYLLLHDRHRDGSHDTQEDSREINLKDRTGLKRKFKQKPYFLLLIRI